MSANEHLGELSAMHVPFWGLFHCEEIDLRFQFGSQGWRRETSASRGATAAVLVQLKCMGGGAGGAFSTRDRGAMPFFSPPAVLLYCHHGSTGPTS